MAIGAGVRGLVAGLVGVAAMTAAEKLEQALTHRPSSFVPGHTLERLLQLPSKPDEERLWMRSEEHTSELQSRQYLVCRLLLEKKKTNNIILIYSFMYYYTYYVYT